jgi:Secretion system C-terminal sorting domain
MLKPSFIDLYKNLCARVKSCCILVVFIICTFFLNKVAAQAPVDPTSIIGKVVCGYQGWFTCTGDGSPINQWTHWSPTNPPQPGVAPNPNPNLTFDAYPDVSIYNPASLFATNFANQGDGSPASLFSDYKQDVTDQHFALMQANGIDGVAFQRFIWEVLVDPRFKANRDSDEVHVRAAAEKYQRLFYLVYDLTGLGNVPATSDQVRLDSVKGDWKNNMLAKLHMTSSSMYATQGGKPVVQIWGIGYNPSTGTSAQQDSLITWFKAQGCYVIIGVPIDWRKGGGACVAGFDSVECSVANMISPWSVGAYSDTTSANTYKTNYLTSDLAYCKRMGIDYQPVIFPGFSWSNWNSGTQNQIPRNKGLFLWHEAENLRALNIKSAEIAMMDEYDEGTAILPMADGYNMIPTNQYFVTTSADGTYLSSDFYLRLAAKVTRQINQLDAALVTVTVPYSVAPMYFRTSNEVKYDPIAVISNNTKSGVTTPACTNATTLANKGSYALKITGTAASATAAYAYFNTFAVNIPVTLTTDLKFWTYPVNTQSRYISVDLLMTDGTTLRSTGAVDMNGVSMHPATGRGTVGSWTETKCNIGQWLNGKTIAQILVAYDHPATSGSFTGYIDDISIVEESYSTLPVKLDDFTAERVQSDVVLKWQAASENSLQNYEVERSGDGIHFGKAGSILCQSLNPARGGSYSFTDKNAMTGSQNSGHLYYRLKMVALDEDFSYSAVVAIAFPQAKSFIMSLYPNPFADIINLGVNSSGDGYLLATVTSVNGEVLKNIKIKVNSGISNISISDLKNLPPGIYFIKLFLNGQWLTYKIEK